MSGISRRDAIIRTGAAALGSLLLPGLTPAQQAAGQGGGKVVKNGRLRQSACYWCYKSRNVSLEDLCKAGAEMGLVAIDLLNENEWPVAKKHGLACSVGMIGAGSISDGLNNKAHHETIITAMTKYIPMAAKEGVPNLICFFGNRRGMSDAEGIENSVACLNRIKNIAEDNNITVVIELLNSKVDHKDYIGDRTSYGVQVVKAVNSPRVKLLYDIYHMQIMEGDVIRTIRENHQYIAHYHTGGVPGRNEIDATQELNYTAISKAILETGFKGYFAHEFIPKRDPITSLREATAICDV